MFKLFDFVTMSIMQQQKKVELSTKLVAILALVAAVALTGAVTMMTEQDASGASHKDFGQCNKNANKANHAANVTGKAGADARKATCKSLKPGKG